MTTLKITKTIEGKKKRQFDLNWGIFIGLILTLPIKLFQLIMRVFGGGKNYTEIISTWTNWYPVNGHEIERKVIAETGFDGTVKFYSLRTNDHMVEEQIKGKIFGEFHCETEYGLFLRLFNNPGDWPISYLVFIDKIDYSFRKVKKINSSWPDWKYNIISNSELTIVTELGDTYTTRLRIIAGKSKPN